MRDNQASMRTDAIESGIFNNLFVSVAEEMGVTLCRTGFSPNIKERLDYSCAIYDRHGHTIGNECHGHYQARKQYRFLPFPNRLSKQHDA